MDTLFFYLSKIGWTLVQPGSLLVYLLVLAVLLLWLGRLRAARALATLAMLLMLVVAVLPLAAWLYQPLEARFPYNPPLPDRVDGIILLGGTIQPTIAAEWGDIALGGSAEREVAFVTLARRHPEARLLMTGGSGNLLNQQLREADLSPQLLQSLQLDIDRVVFERESRNTWENAVKSRPLLQPLPGEVWVVITSAFHMPRAVGVFCAQGWPVVPWPVDYKIAPEDRRPGFNLAGRLQNLNQVLHEWLGLVAYRVAGKTQALLPAHCEPA